MRELWAGLLELRVEAVGVDVDLFALGAHSLLLLRFVNAAQARLDVRLPMRVVFEGPTVRALAGELEAAQARDRVEELELLELIEGLSDEEVRRLLGDG